ncbi:SURF1 family cytochrome oxidase biogenesis protein [Qipengyuania qiaonensis]|uniref:SURF1-like protein n=1 Tax=Qipengyuania qiaonensis TaxID=2867240 RepID=A0ABS7JBL3_9SPHN|nr:SURF1 family cytochrome oxidase biogenesis protein [Qipengyuania qiaonensis]MBX7483073.1 SURF1 family protein [Qipengyuania qiaonensis]
MRVPILPTILVAAAVATMIALGIWQLGRMEEKEALIARAERSLALSENVEYPRDPAVLEEVLYRRSNIDCVQVDGITTVAGTSLRGEKGVAQRATCTLADGGRAIVDLGFSRNPAPVDWSGGEVRGTIAPGGRLVAVDEIAGLQMLASPDPRDLPNNHLAYAGQWFFFALTALVIYILALRRRKSG